MDTSTQSFEEFLELPVNAQPAPFTIIVCHHASTEQTKMLDALLSRWSGSSYLLLRDGGKEMLATAKSTARPVVWLVTSGYPDNTLAASADRIYHFPPGGGIEVITSPAGEGALYRPDLSPAYLDKLRAVVKTMKLPTKLYAFICQSTGTNPAKAMGLMSLLVDACARTLARFFTEKDVDEILAFANSPVGQKWFALSMDVESEAASHVLSGLRGAMEVVRDKNDESAN